ncbi:MAG: hypothetical protein WA738_05775, partial [Candidatus Angelobacter sp.]
MFGRLLLGGGLLGTVPVPGVHGFAAVAEVPSGREVPLAVVEVLDPLLVEGLVVEVEGLVVDEVVPVEDVVPLVPVVVEVLLQGPATVGVVCPMLPPVTLPALPAT